ncbi:hypothetical protein BN1195_03259 [Chryseobacterium oranimense G311]|nr:hypothetical protein BN1195_03259 [Chryseobacterium oranimense G311]
MFIMVNSKFLLNYKFKILFYIYNEFSSLNGAFSKNNKCNPAKIMDYRNLLSLQN